MNYGFCIEIFIWNFERRVPMSDEVLAILNLVTLWMEFGTYLTRVRVTGDMNAKIHLYICFLFIFGVVCGFHLNRRRVEPISE